MLLRCNRRSRILCADRFGGDTDDPLTAKYRDLEDARIQDSDAQP
jgi:hypothetical protein